MSAPDRTYHRCYWAEPLTAREVRAREGIQDWQQWTRKRIEKWETQGGKESREMTGKANDRQEGGDHYRTPVQMWDFLLANDVPWLEGTIMCYVFRHRKKHGLADLRKAAHCLQKLIEVEEAKIVGNG